MSSYLPDLLARVRSFVDERLVPFGPLLLPGDFEEPLPEMDEVQAEVRAAGLWNPHLPKTDGGLGPRLDGFGRVSETLGRSLLGPCGSGFLLAQGRRGPGRIQHQHRMCLIGVCERVFDFMCRYAGERELAPGRMLPAQGAVQKRIAESRTETDAARLYDDPGEVHHGVAAREELRHRGFTTKR